MSTETEKLRSSLQQLRLAGQGLADLLTLDADRLDAEGWPPSRVLSDDLRSFREQVSSLASLLLTGCDTQGRFVEPGARHIQSLTEIALELDYRETATLATQVARSILQISPRDGQAPEGLDGLQSAALEMVASQGLNEPREQIHSIVEGEHPWCNLLRMIREGASLPDSEWTLLNSSIECELGLPLAVAAARGRLQLPLPHVEQLTRNPVALPSESRPEQPPVSPMPPSLAEVQTPQEFDSLGTSPAIQPPPIAPQNVVDTESVQFRSDFVGSPPRFETRSSGLAGAAARALSEISAIGPIGPLTTETISEASPAPDARIDEAISSEPTARVSIPNVNREVPIATPQSASDDDQSHSVFDDIQLISPNQKFAAPQPVPVLPAQRQRALPKSAPASVSLSSIFDEDADDEDELIQDREENLPAILSAQPLTTVGVTAPSPLAKQLLAQARFIDATGPAASLATMILNGPESEREAVFPDLILHLIHEGRPGLAYHLSRCLESRSANLHPFVPSWLIRTWTYGHALVFPKGQLAGLVQEDLQSRSLTGLRVGNTDWNLALSLLVRAATLRPAIIAPSSRAAAVLRDFELSDGCVQLYNYCSRIGTYGERIQGVFPGLFKQSSSSVPYSDQLSTLRSDIARWREASETVAVKYQIATQLFQKAGWSLRAGTSQRCAEASFDWMNWQIALRLGESLVTPVIRDSRTELSRVKADVEEISTKLSAPDDPEGRRHLSQPEIRAYLRQAITFAQRWIGLHSGAATTEAQNYLPQAAVELRSEIQNRHELVLHELRTLASEHTSFEVRMAVACLMLSVQEIHDLVDPHIPTDAREADPRHLLHSDLLKFSDISLNSTWEPEGDFHLLEDEILHFLSQPQPDWTTAFQVQMAQGSHQTAERILSLAIWTNEEREALQSFLELERSRQKHDFERELNDVNTLLKESVHLDILKDTERVGYEARLMKLKRSLSSANDVSSGILELGRVRESLVKRREREATRIRTRLHQLSSPPAEEQASPSPGSPPHEKPSQRGWIMDFDQ